MSKIQRRVFMASIGCAVAGLLGAKETPAAHCTSTTTVTYKEYSFECESIRKIVTASKKGNVWEITVK